MTASLLSLSSAAIVSVYAVGYLNTASGASDLQAVTLPPAAAATAAPERTIPPISSDPRNRAGGSFVAPTPTPATGSQRQTGAATYADGTYVGVGTSRHGSIQATVVVQGGKITSAAITGCQTRYPCSKVGSLPGQVIARQTAQVNYVSGATDSSRAYIMAVTNALAQARA